MFDLYEVEIWYSQSNTREKHIVVASTLVGAMAAAVYYYMTTSIPSYRSGFNTIESIQMICKNWVGLI